MPYLRVLRAPVVNSALPIYNQRALAVRWFLQYLGFSLMSTPSPTAATYSVAGDRYTLLLTAAQTSGRYAVIDAFVPVGGGTPPHVHQREDEAFFVIEGEFEFTVDGKPARVGPDGFLFGPRGVPHNFKNVGTTPGRMIITIKPGGFEEYFVEVGTPLENPDAAPVPPTPEAIETLIRLAPKYGVQIL